MRVSKTTLAGRLVVWIGVPAAALFATVLWFSSQRSMRRVVAETGAVARATARANAARVNGRLCEAAKVALMHARVLEAGVFRTSAELENYLREAVAKNEDIYGSCIAFK